MRAAIYARVSTDEQVEGYSLDAQLRACRQHCSDRGWQVVAEYVEEGRSARHEDLRRRPQFSAMMQAADSRAFDLVLVHKLDRFARNTLVLLTCLNRLGNAGVAFASVTEQQLDYSTPQGRLFLVMLGALAEWYSNNLSHETRKGKAERKAQGLYNGLLPFGLVKGEDGLPVPDKRQLQNGSCNWEGYLLAMRTAAEGASDAEVARALNARGFRTTGNRGQNLWRKDSVRRLLTNRIFLGELPDGKGGWLPGKHSAYVDRELFERVQAARGENRTFAATRSTNGRGQTYSLTGLLRCWYCQEAQRRPGTVQITHQRDAIRTYCYGRNQGLDCPQRGTLLEVVEAQIEDWLAGIVLPDDVIERAIAELARQAREIDDPERERRQLENRLARLREMYEWGDLSRAEYQLGRDQIRQRLQALAPTSRQRRDLEMVASLVRSAHATWRASDGPQRNRLLTSLVSKVVIKDDQVVEIAPRPDVSLLVPGGSILSTVGRKRRGSLPLDRAQRYSVPHNLLPTERLREIAEDAATSSIAQAAREHNISRQTVRRALELHGLASPWEGCRH